MLRSPYELPISGIALPNRICKAATSEHLGCPRRNEVSPELVRLYERWGRGGAGLIITGNVMVQRTALEAPRNVVLDEMTCLKKIAAWALAAKSGGGRAIVQLSHPGRQSPVSASWARPAAPSSRRLKLAGVGVQLHRLARKMTAEEIGATVQAFGNASRLAVQSGFDGVQIHAAHGYLLSQFLSPVGNSRSDCYGGNPESRRRPVLAAVRAARNSVGPAKIVAVKVNWSDFEDGGFDLAGCAALLRALEGIVDFVELSAGTYAGGMACMGDPSDFSTMRPIADIAEDLATTVSFPLVITGGIHSPDTAESLARRGFLIGVARPLCVDPDLPGAWLADLQCKPPRPVLPAPARAAPTALRRILLPGLRYGWYQRQLWRIAAGLPPAQLWHTPYVFFYLPRALFFEPARLSSKNCYHCALAFMSLLACLTFRAR